MTAHIHHKEMRLYAEDAAETDKPWERWENANRYETKWYNLPCHPSWLPDVQYRRKPKTVKVRLYNYFNEICAVTEGQVMRGSCVFDWIGDWIEVEVKE